MTLFDFILKFNLSNALVNGLTQRTCVDIYDAEFAGNGQEAIIIRD